MDAENHSQLPPSTEGYRAVIAAPGDVAALVAEWRAIEETITSPTFLNSDWIASWLASYHPGLRVLRVEHCAETVALGLFALRRERRHGILRSQVAYLHQTGLPHEDQIWVEYNGLLAKGDHARAGLRTAVQALLCAGHCDEVQLSMLPAELAAQLEADLAALSLSSRRVLEQAGFMLDAPSADDPMTLFSANTRAQLRRSIRRYEEHYGAATVDDAASAAQALEWFHAAGAWHRQRWSDSGFGNPAFVDFHERLVKRGFDHGRVRLFRVAFGRHPIGCFYYLVDGRRAYFYLQGVQAEADGKMKPGLTGHYLVMRQLIAEGIHSYDFMGGDSQYKRQLSNRESAFVSLRVHGGAQRFRVEDRLRGIRSRFAGA